MAWDSISRTLTSRITYVGDDGETEFPSGAIQSWSISQLTESNSLLSMGEFCENSISLTYYNIDSVKKFSWNNKIISVYIKEENEDEVKVGTFHVLKKDVTTNDNGMTYNVTGYDIPQGMLEEFDNTQTTSSVSDIVSFITKKFGITLASGTTFTLDEIETVDEGTTYVELLADIAGYDGYNLRMNANGELERYWFDMQTTDNTITIPYSIQFMNELNDLVEVEKVNSIICYTSSDEYIASGSGTNSIEFENPYMTQSQLDSIFARIVKDEYVTGNVRWRGNPYIKAGDVVFIEVPDGETSTKYMYFPIMENSINYDGGFNMQSTSYSYEGEQTVIGNNTSPTEKKIQVAYNGLRDEYRRATGIIADNLSSGHYRLIEDENNKYPLGFVLTDSETITDITKGWRFTQGGLEYSEDGFQTVSKVGITMDGKIVADSVSAHSLTIEAFDEELTQEINSIQTKSTIFYTRPVAPYNVNDLWCQGKKATSDESTVDDTEVEDFVGDILICVNAKAKDEEFSDEDWTFASKYTGDYYAKLAELQAQQAQASANQADEEAKNALEQAQQAQSSADTASSQAQSAQDKADANASSITNINSKLDEQSASITSVEEKVSTAQQTADDLNKDFTDFKNGAVNDLLQRTTIDLEGIKIQAVKGSDTYLSIKNDGVRIYVNGNEDPVSAYLADYSSVAKIFTQSGKLVKHIVQEFTVDGVTGTAFFYDES